MDKPTLRTLRAYLSDIAFTATMAQRVRVESDMMELLDDLDATVQAAIALLRHEASLTTEGREHD